LGLPAGVPGLRADLGKAYIRGKGGEGRRVLKGRDERLEHNASSRETYESGIQSSARKRKMWKRGGVGTR